MRSTRPTGPRVNVTLVVDRSGSMDIRERLGLVQSSLALLADRLNGDDMVSVVSFEDQATPILEPTPVRQTDKIIEAVESLKPGGSTNLEAGLRLGYQQARESFDDDAVNLVVLCSDGVANVGRTGPGSITEQIAEEGADGIHLVTVGYGMGNYNDHLMEQLADLGDGFYSYVDTFDEAEQLFGSDLTTTLTPVAGEARTQVEFDPALVTAYRLIGYDNRAIADDEFDNMAVDAGELGAGHRATALYEVRLADGVEPGATIGTATVRWTSTETGRTRTVTADLVAAAADANPSADLALATTVADLAQLLKAAEPVADRGLDLDVLEERARALGASELLTMIEQARAGCSEVQGRYRRGVRWNRGRRIVKLGRNDLGGGPPRRRQAVAQATCSMAQKRVGEYFLAEEVARVLRATEANLVLDVGANVGQFAEALRGSGYRGRIASFEPVAAPFARLQCGRRGGRAVVDVPLRARRRGRHRRDQPGAGHDELDAAGERVRQGVVGQAAAAAHRDDPGTPAGVGARRGGRRARPGPGVPRRWTRRASTSRSSRAPKAELEAVVALQSEMSCVPIYDGMPRLPQQWRSTRTLGFEAVGRLTR